MATHRAATPVTTSGPDVAPVPARLEAVVVKREVTITTQFGTSRESSTTQATEWRVGTKLREESGAYGIVPAKTTLWDAADRSLWLIDDATRRYGPFDVEPVAGAARRVLAVDLGFSVATNDVLIVPDPLLSPVAAEPPTGIVTGSGPGRAYRLNGDTKRVEIELWVVPGLPLTARDFADAYRRRLQPPWTVAEQQMFAALEALPGYPAHVRTTTRGKGNEIVIVNTVVDVQRQTIDPALVSLPTDYERVDSGMQLLTQRFVAERAAQRKAGRAKLGLDQPYVTTAKKPLPPALPGGSCRPGRDRCIETWDGVDTNFSGNCDRSFDFVRPCPRTKLVGICESHDREKLEYFYRPAKPPQCEGRWYANPAATSPRAVPQKTR